MPDVSLEIISEDGLLSSGFAVLKQAQVDEGVVGPERSAQTKVTICLGFPF
jgi:hypothetical protein